ncbi:MAG: hypothetical protein K2N78_09085 [Oscillospiraceae bacterium]|nr:hypothetical protein [Oscillospiraceae bacterium]
MSKKRKNGPGRPEVEKQSEYYRLKTKAVDDLVSAHAENSPQVSEEELRAYRSGPKMKVADWVKMLFIKGWFAGAVCFFFIWGLGGLLGNELDILFVTGMALGLVTDWLTNPVLRFFEKTPGENARWMMVNRKGTVGLFLNILYGYLLLFLVYLLYNGINLVASWIIGTAGAVVLGVEPILFGAFCLGFDLLLLQLKQVLSRAFHRTAPKTTK